MHSRVHKASCMGGWSGLFLGVFWTLVWFSPCQALGLETQTLLPHKIGFSNTNSYIDISSGQHKRRSAMALEADFPLAQPLSLKTQILLMPAVIKNSRNVSVLDHHYWMNLALQYTIQKFVDFSFFSGPGINYWRSVVSFQNTEETYSGYQLGLVTGGTVTYQASLNWSVYLQGLYLNRFEDDKQDYCWGVGVGYLI
jgi:hypothetical protein